MTNGATHQWKFFRAGGFDQVRLSTGADLIALGELDQKLWVALACPAKGLECDARTLELVDSEGDGRVRAAELIAAVTWSGRVFRNADVLVAGAAELPLGTLSDATDDGRKVLAAAKTVLKGLGRPEASMLTVNDAAGAVQAFDQLAFNGDGVVPPESLTDEVARAACADVIACVGGEPDRGGKQGVSAAKVDAFFKELASYVEWRSRSEGDDRVLPLADQTADAALALDKVRVKIDDYFARCRLAAFDARALSALNREEKEYLHLVAKDLTITADEVASFPLARIEAGRPLPLEQGVNPAWAGALADFASRVVTPLLGARPALGEQEWLQVRARFEPFQAWQAAKAGAAVEKLGAARAKELLSGDARRALDAALAEEQAQAPIASSITDLERAVRYHRDLFALARNFVSFQDFYERKRKAHFQVGTLYIDQRACELCVRVDDAAKHASLAPHARSYLLYCDCARPASGEKLQIAAAVTAGDSDNLMVGRNGVFYDRQGRDWDATVTKIVDNPISVRQAFWSPYKKALRYIEEQVAKRAAAADTTSQDKLLGTVKQVEGAADTGKAGPAPKKIDVGTVAALGVAVGGITAAIGALLQTFFGLGFWMPLGLVGLLLCISGPSMLIAWLKLRHRNLGPLLDANGWAVNAPALVNVPLGASLTRTAQLPPGSSRELSDPFAEKRRAWWLWVLLAAVVVVLGAWYLGKLDRMLPPSAKSSEVLGDLAPTVTQPAPTPAPTSP